MEIFRVALDTNVFISSGLSNNSTSPNKEAVKRWREGEFQLLYSLSTLMEYKEKLLEKGQSPEDVEDFLVSIIELAEEVYIEFFHFWVYPGDADDTALLLCAWNGEATHLVTHDFDLLDIADFYQAKIKIWWPRMSFFWHPPEAD